MILDIELTRGFWKIYSLNIRKGVVEMQWIYQPNYMNQNYRK